MSKYANDVPIVVIATKKDDFLDIEFGARRKALKKESKRFDEEACEQYAEERLHERVETIRSEMESVPGGRLDACLAVSQGMLNVSLIQYKASICRMSSYNAASTSTAQIVPKTDCSRR